VCFTSSKLRVPGEKADEIVELFAQIAWRVVASSAAIPKFVRATISPRFIVANGPHLQKELAKPRFWLTELMERKPSGAHRIISHCRRSLRSARFSSSRIFLSSASRLCCSPRSISDPNVPLSISRRIARRSLLSAKNSCRPCEFSATNPVQQERQNPEVSRAGT
jgi:hypothetical protein